MYKKFEELLAQRGVKPSDVCRATGVSKSVLSRWKSGKFTPKHDKIQKIADYFDVPVDYFYLDEAVQEHNESVEAMTPRDYIYSLVSDYMDAVIEEMSKHEYSEEQIEDIVKYARLVGRSDDYGNEHKD